MKFLTIKNHYQGAGGRSTIININEITSITPKQTALVGSCTNIHPMEVDIIKMSNNEVFYAEPMTWDFLNY